MLARVELGAEQSQVVLLAVQRIDNELELGAGFDQLISLDIEAENFFLFFTFDRL